MWNMPGKKCPSEIIPEVKVGNPIESQKKASIESREVKVGNQVETKVKDIASKERDDAMNTSDFGAFTIFRVAVIVLSRGTQRAVDTRADTLTRVRNPRSG